VKQVAVETSFHAKEGKKVLTVFGLCWKYSRMLNRNDKNNRDNKRSKAFSVARTIGISVARTIGISVARTTGISVARTTGISVARTNGISVARTTGISKPIVIILNTNIMLLYVVILILILFAISEYRMRSNLLLPAELLRRQKAPLVVVPTSLLHVKSNNL
jgi:hypothetical protein